MRLNAPARSGFRPGHSPRTGLRAAGPYVLVALALLVASELLWLWHSWPVRQVLDSESPAVEVSL
ncbi:MAG: hypothetical protein NDJ19_02860 [Ramlibacter sp.]|nr:hypothetical protein [Ramlibacter sp.]